MATKETSRRCARSGCRAWAMRGREHCAAHRAADLARSPSSPGDADTDSAAESDVAARERRRRAVAFAELVRGGRHADLVEDALRTVIAASGGELSLGQEIGALRLILSRVLAVDALEGDPREVATTMTRLVDAIVRAVRLQRNMSGDLAESLSSAFTTILNEMGLGDEP